MAEASPKAQTADVIGDVMQVCMVTKDHVRTMDSLLKIGIGPWRIFKFDPSNTSDTHYRGKPHSFTAVMAYANSANMVWEVVEPAGGTSIFEDFLRHKGSTISQSVTKAIVFRERWSSSKSAVSRLQR